MSEHNDHSHPHPHPERPKSEPPAPAPRPESIEDAGSHALSEALRSSFIIVKIIMVILLVVFFASGFFTVSSQERAIVLRFGKAVGTGDEQLLGPGAHWSFPYPIDEVVRIPYSQYQTVRSTTGWYATTPEAEAMNAEGPPGSTLNPAADGYTLTADTNIIHMRAELRYRINRPVDYALNFVNASNLVQNALDSALFQASTYFNVDEALVRDKLGLKERVTQRVRQVVDEQGLGISVEQVYLETKAPRYVNPSFEAVLSADIESRQTNQLAQTYANKVRSTAKGEATSLVNAGKTDAARLLQELAAEAKYFTNQLPHYLANPQLFEARLRSDAVYRMFTNNSVQKYPIIRRRGERPTELRIQLGPEPQKPAAASEQ